MRGEKRLRRGILIGGLLLSGAAGCMLTSPLDDYPTEAAGGGAGASGPSGGSQNLPDAGAENLNEAGRAGAAPFDGECQTNADCAKGSGGVPYRCRPSDNTCQVIKTGECPIVEGDFANANAIYIGSFANLNAADPQNNAIVQAQLLALDDFSGENLGGLRDPSGGPRRPLVMVVCNNSETASAEGLRHLVEDLEVPGVLATLRPGDLRRGFDDYGSRDVFFLSPVSVTQPIVTEEDNGLIWNLLGQPADFGPAYQKLLEHAEAYVRAAAEPAIPPSTPIKVALVTTDSAFDSDLENQVASQLKFNGDYATANGANYMGVELNEDSNLFEEGYDIAAFAPHIIVSMSGGVMTSGGLIEIIESEWGAATGNKPLPFFMLSPYDSGDLGSVYQQILDDAEFADDESAQNRFVGITIASAEDTSLQNDYAIRLSNKFDGAYTDTANYYDAFYYLAYAIYAAGTDEPLTGSGIARGMKRLLSGPKFTPVPTTITEVFDILDDPEKTVTLESTLGPPNFDPVNGSRPIDAGLICFTRFGQNVTLHRDVRRFDRESGRFVGSGQFCDSTLVP